MTPAELRALCLAFDKEKRYYPEDAWQGLALLEFFMSKLGTPLTADETAVYTKEIGIELP